MRRRSGLHIVRTGWDLRLCAVFGVVLGVFACSPIGGLDNHGLGETNSGVGTFASSSSVGGGAGEGGTGGAFTTSGAGGASNEGGKGGAGGSGGMVCIPGATMPCYSGPVDTINVGNCKAGQQICLADGSGHGPCTGEVIPAVEDCMAPGDEDCDGYADQDDSECL